LSNVDLGNRYVICFRKSEGRRPLPPTLPDLSTGVLISAEAIDPISPKPQIEPLEK